MWKNQYNEELFSQLLPYLKWKEQNSKTKNLEMAAKDSGAKKICFGDCSSENFFSLNKEMDFVIIHEKDGELATDAEAEFARAFKENPNALVCYADEDYLGTLPDDIVKNFSPEELSSYQYQNTGLYPQNPWFKPEFSPDTLASFFYFGNVIAVNLKNVEKLSVPFLKNFSKEAVYQWILSLPQKKEYFCHVEKVLFTNRDLCKKDELPCFNPDKKEICDDDSELVSIVIPSKDHPEILDRCLTSLLEKTDYRQFECIIVDNGSNSDNRQWITDRLQTLEKQFSKQIQYLYEKMPFNFSKMCNLGVEKAHGEYILLLNDDMEIVDPLWLGKMLFSAKKAHVGAAGAKLYYPDSKLIQHVGITNMGIGPAHKLGGLEDNQNYYHGKNVVTYDMLAVTAACLLVKKDKYVEVNGFDEELTVAYNDVDFCFKLYEKGYYNVVRNDVILYHHESLSRGQDDSLEKKKRLFQEKTLLYMKHPDLKAKDPFYHKDLVQWKKDTMYHCNFVYPYDEVKEVTEVSGKLPRVMKQKYLKKLTGENLSMLQIDAIEEEEQTIIRGWHVLRQIDNRFLDKYLLLFCKESGKIYQVKMEKVLRKDVEQLFCNESDESTKGAALSGFCVKFDKMALPKGEYEVGVLVTNVPRSWRNMIYQGGKIWTRSLTVLKRN